MYTNVHNKEYKQLGQTTPGCMLHLILRWELSKVEVASKLNQQLKASDVCNNNLYVKLINLKFQFKIWNFSIMVDSHW